MTYCRLSLFLPNLIEKKWKSFCSICSYASLLLKPTKPRPLSLSQREIETDSIPIAFGLATMGESIVGVTVVKSQFATTIFEMDQRCRHVA